MMGKRVLIIDDEPDTVFILRFALEKAGYEVVSVDNVAEALPIARSREIDIVLLDLVLNAGNGLEVCRELRSSEATRYLPIILVTGKLRTEFDTVEGFRAGADDYVMKPFRPAEVVARVETLLDRSQRLRDISALTGLPGPRAIEERFQRLVDEPGPWGVMSADLNGFKYYNSAYGFGGGDGVLRQMAACLTSAARDDENAFVGHAGGDNFVVVTTPDHLDDMSSRAIAAFEQAKSTLYPPEVAAAGTMSIPSRRGGETLVPLISLTLAGVTNELRTFTTPLQIVSIAKELQDALKSRTGSAYIKDRRTDDEPR